MKPGDVNDRNEWDDELFNGNGSRSTLIASDQTAVR